VPRNRQHIPHEERRAALLEAATEVFVSKGYVATSMDDISKAADVARANVYWYYPSKDHIFAAVMNQMLELEIARMTVKHKRSSPERRLILGLIEMFPYRSLHREMHERMPYSEAVAAAHETFMTWMRERVYEVVADSEVDTDREMVADITLSIFEGSHTAGGTHSAYEMIEVFLASILRSKPKRKGPAKPRRTVDSQAPA
jgi:AcrR family transcriptional regulator